ncbi:hypothetical protein KC909_03350 [Candidatus Dojkabacteria bacterium]|uniref:Uncharacterized protein n=1 Tax=Candidatus Dojkabacteria bacterium TaxID=2099670 RepID=A0A955L5Q5_9BACT|nr:hypothetical protein [Candidatus Dojkabacteria bacterium]
MSELEFYPIQPEGYSGPIQFHYYQVLPGINVSHVVVNHVRPDETAAAIKAYNEQIQFDRFFGNTTVVPKLVLAEAPDDMQTYYAQELKCPVKNPFLEPLSTRALELFCSDTRLRGLTKEEREVGFWSAWEYIQSQGQIPTDDIQAGLETAFSYRYPNGDYQTRLSGLRQSLISQGYGMNRYLAAGMNYFTVFREDLSADNQKSLVRELRLSPAGHTMVMAGAIHNNTVVNSLYQLRHELAGF